MNPAEKYYLEIGKSIPEASESQLFGKPCFKVNGKAFVCFFQEEMVFKLNGNEHTKAMALKGAKLFDPSGKGRPMKEWVQVPFQHVKIWKELAEAAFNYVQ